jgi:hypothetical protein
VHGALAGKHDAIRTPNGVGGIDNLDIGLGCHGAECPQHAA